MTQLGKPLDGLPACDGGMLWSGAPEWGMGWSSSRSLVLVSGEVVSSSVLTRPQ